MNSPHDRPFQTLRRFARARPAAEHCGLCNRVIPEQHPHILDLGEQAGGAAGPAPLPRVVCGCPACALLFDGGKSRYRRIPGEVEHLADFDLPDEDWDSLHIPIGLAFLFTSSRSAKVVAHYPSPAGATEALLPLDAWPGLVERNPVLGRLQPDVEALLVNRVGSRRDHYRAPIDACYRLVGLIRTHWRGLSGGTEVWDAVEQFFGELRARSDG